MSASSTLSLCPTSVISWLRELMLQSFAVVSMLPVTKRTPSPHHRSDRMHSSWYPISLLHSPLPVSSISSISNTRMKPSSHPHTKVWLWCGWNRTTRATLGERHRSSSSALFRSHTWRLPCSEQETPYAPSSLSDMQRTMSGMSAWSGSLTSSVSSETSMACSRSPTSASSSSARVTVARLVFSILMLASTVCRFHTLVSLSSPEVTSHAPSSDTEVRWMISECAASSSRAFSPSSMSQK
mmetsp:Transcript_22360/g.52853  ORF Transcript_22360/g.52853 Transcript_22360/m.52853 type:complete len:240 (+) Transcript_22360:505-1224(+)